MFDKENLSVGECLDQSTSNWMCSLCAENGITAYVRLHRLNGDYAIWFCETPLCTYPLKDDQTIPIIVYRPDSDD